LINLRSIHIRLPLWYTIIIILTAAGFGAYTYWSLQQRLFLENWSIAQRRITRITQDIEDDINRPPPALANKIEHNYSPEHTSRFIRIRKADGTVLYVSGNPEEPTYDPSTIPLLPPSQYTDDLSEPAPWLQKTQQFVLLGKRVKIGEHFYIAESGVTIQPIHESLHKLVVTLLISLPIVVAIASLGGFILVRRALRPVEDMRATAEHISFSQPAERRLPISRSGDQIEQLGTTLNQMLDRLDRAYQHAERFSADASHELRTPLTVMRSEIETLLREPGLTASVRERIASMLEENERLSVVVENLFSLALLDAGAAMARQEIVDLAEMVRLTVDQMRLMADEKKITVSMDAPMPVRVIGDTQRLKQVIVNLFDNATKYTPTDGKIDLTVKAAGSKALFTVKDNGTGIPADALPHIFERFYRADKARSRAIEGAGLGLSIVQTICQAHGGVARVESKEDVGTLLTVELPLVATQA